MFYIKQANYFPESDYGLFALLGCKEMGWNYILFDDIGEVPFNKNVVLVSDIDDTLEYFKRNLINIPSALNIPEKLNSMEFLKRKVTKMDIDEDFKALDLPVFIKPLRVKKFESGVAKKKETINWLYNSYYGEKAIVSEVLNIVSEFRVYVHNHEAKGINCYAGDCTKTPNGEFINKAIEVYKNSPVSYTLDVGVTDTGETILIECNDFWSIGNYGLDARVYVKMLRDRWREIVDKYVIVQKSEK